MTTLLFYLVIAAAIGIVVFFLAVFVFGRGEQMAPLDPRTSPAELPDSDINGDDVRKIRFALALRGYRMSDVDWTLERLSDQIDELRRDNAALRAAGEDLSLADGAHAPDLVSVGVGGVGNDSVDGLRPIGSSVTALPVRASVAKYDDHPDSLRDGESGHDGAQSEDQDGVQAKEQGSGFSVGESGPER